MKNAIGSNRAWVTVVSIFAGTALCAAATPAATIDITSCGTIVPERKTGVVQSDLDCTGQSLAGLLNLSTLDLNGHVVHGEVSQTIGRKATIVGPGTLIGRITGGFENRKLVIRGVDVVADGWGVFSSSGTVDAVDSTFTGATTRAIQAPKVKLTGVDVSNNPVADFAVFAEKLRGKNVIANNNGTPGCTDCSAVFAYGTAKLVGLQASGNTGHGVLGVTRLKLFNSSVTGNNGRGLGIDVAAGGNLISIDTTCGLSGSSDPPYSPGYWGVCTND
jgi:hypothetical protein